MTRDVPNLIYDCNRSTWKCQWTCNLKVSLMQGFNSLTLAFDDSVPHVSFLVAFSAFKEAIDVDFNCAVTRSTKQQRWRRRGNETKSRFLKKRQKASGLGAEKLVNS